MTYTLQITGLTHSFSKEEVVLSGVDIQVPAGSIYGFLGPNGAGKTTTLKLALGLLKKQSGTIRIPDRRYVGSLIETPSLYGHLTARENLEVWRKLYGIPPTRIDEVLRLVGLQNTKNKAARKFSLGMRQRLSIAVALLNDPSLLILDEPTNGLDPNGMIEMRTLLQQLNRERGTTILISSHLLSEITKLVTHVGVIAGGRMVFEGPLDTLLTRRRSPEHDLETIFMDLIQIK